jgi:hypothetical protein
MIHTQIHIHSEKERERELSCISESFEGTTRGKRGKLNVRE